jgi:cobalt-zinc-cadmium efflux system outer membrane protein
MKPSCASSIPGHQDASGLQSSGAGLAPHSRAARTERQYTLRVLGEKVRQAVATVPGAVDVSVEQPIDGPILGVRVPIPLFNRYQGRIHEAKADFVADEARARSVRNELTLELQTSYRTLARAIAAAQLLREEILPRAESVLRRAETRYANGDISLAELLPIRRDWTRERLDYLEALNEVTQAWAALAPYV